MDGRGLASSRRTARWVRQLASVLRATLLWQLGVRIESFPLHLRQGFVTPCRDAKGCMSCRWAVPRPIPRGVGECRLSDPLVSLHGDGFVTDRGRLEGGSLGRRRRYRAKDDEGCSDRQGRDSYPTRTASSVQRTALAGHHSSAPSAHTNRAMTGMAPIPPIGTWPGFTTLLYSAPVT